MLVITITCAKKHSLSASVIKTVASEIPNVISSLKLVSVTVKVSAFSTRSSIVMGILTHLLMSSEVKDRVVAMAV